MVGEALLREDAPLLGRHVARVARGRRVVGRAVADLPSDARQRQQDQQEQEQPELELAAPQPPALDPAFSRAMVPDSRKFVSVEIGSLRKIVRAFIFTIFWENKKRFCINFFLNVN